MIAARADGGCCNVREASPDARCGGAPNGRLVLPMVDAPGRIGSSKKGNNEPDVVRVLVSDVFPDIPSINVAVTS